MKKLYVAILLLFLASFSFAQQDPKAKALLEAVSNKFKSYQTVSANVAYQVQNSSGKILIKKNGVVNMKGQKYSIVLGNDKIISDGNTVWNYDPSAKEVTVNNAGNTGNTITPQKLFTNFYQDEFYYTMGGIKKFGNKNVQEIILKPMDSKKPFQLVYVWIDKATNTIVSTNIVEKGGSRYMYTLGNLKTNISLPDAQFTFNTANYPGVEVVDLR